MKLLVCISKVPDTTAKISFKDNNTKFNEDNVQFIINPYDEWYALVRALELKEAAGGSVTVINVGPPANEQTIRKALAIGADDAVRINAVVVADQKEWRHAGSLGVWGLGVRESKEFTRRGRRSHAGG